MHIPSICLEGYSAILLKWGFCLGIIFIAVSPSCIGAQVPSDMWLDAHAEGSPQYSLRHSSALHMLSPMLSLRLLSACGPVLHHLLWAPVHLSGVTEIPTIPCRPRSPRPQREVGCFSHRCRVCPPQKFSRVHLPSIVTRREREELRASTLRPPSWLFELGKQLTFARWIMLLPWPCA